MEIRLIIPGEGNDAASRMFRPLISLMISMYPSYSIDGQSVIEQVLTNVHEDEDGEVVFTFENGQTFRLSNLDTIEVL